MPGITIRKYDPNNKDVNALGDKERVTRQRYIAERWRYYDGNHDKPLKVRPGEKDDNILFNLCGRAVDKTVEFLGVPDKFEVGDVTESESSTAEDALNGAYKASEPELPEIIQSGAIAGHTYIKLYYDDTDSAGMTLLDPQYVTVYWDAMNVKRVMFYRLQWKQGDVSYMQDIVPSWLLDDSEINEYASIASYWKIYDYEQAKGNGTWRLLREQKHEFTFAPLVEWAWKRRPHTYYGTSFLHNSIGLNNSVNFIASNTARIIKHHAHPKTFAFGFEVSDENAVGGLWDGLPADGKVETLELKGDLQSSMKMLDSVKAEFFASQRVLDLATVQDKLGQITNFGVRMIYSDMVEMATEARNAIGLGLAEVYRRLMLMDNVAVEEKPTPVWPDLLPQNRLEVLQSATLEKNLGTTSQQTLTESIDRDPKLEAQRKAEEGTTAGGALVDVLTRVGERGLLGGNGSSIRQPAA